MILVYLSIILSVTSLAASSLGFSSPQTGFTASGAFVLFPSILYLLVSCRRYIAFNRFNVVCVIAFFSILLLYQSTHLSHPLFPIYTSRLTLGLTYFFLAVVGEQLPRNFLFSSWLCFLTPLLLFLSLLLTLIASISGALTHQELTGAFAFNIYPSTVAILSDGSILPLVTYQTVSLYFVALAMLFSLHWRLSFRLFTIIAAVLLLLISGSRSQLIAYLVSIVAFYAYSLLHRHKARTTVPARRLLLFFLTFASIVAICALYLFSADIPVRLLSIDSFLERVRLDSANSRLDDFRVLFGCLQSDLFCISDPGSYSHSFLDFLFSYGLLLTSIILLIFFRSIPFILSRLDLLFPFVYIMAFGHSTSMLFFALIGALCSTASATSRQF